MSYVITFDIWEVRIMSYNVINSYNVMSYFNSINYDAKF